MTAHNTVAVDAGRVFEANDCSGGSGWEGGWWQSVAQPGSGGKSIAPSFLLGPFSLSVGMRTFTWALLALACTAVVRPVIGGKITTSRPFLIDSTVADMQWVNSSLKDAKPNAKTVFVRSTLGSIYRSTDDGMNWVSQRDKMASDDDEPYKTRIQQMMFSKADAKYALMKGYSENIWFTKDQGNTYKKHAFGVMMDIKLHTRQPEWVLATKFEGSFPDRYLSLFLSVDFGASWKKLVTHVYQFEWVRIPPSAMAMYSAHMAVCRRYEYCFRDEIVHILTMLQLEILTWCFFRRTPRWRDSQTKPFLPAFGGPTRPSRTASQIGIPTLTL